MRYRIMCGLVVPRYYPTSGMLFSGFKFVLVIFQEAKEKFQQLQKVISILGDEEKRAVYDETGYAGDDVSALFLDVLSSL